MRATARASASLATITWLSAAPSVLAQPHLPLPAAAPPAVGTLFLARERVVLQDGSLVDADRGMLYVPLLRAEPSRGVVAVEIWRFRADTPSVVPPVFRLHGGPGFEGLAVDLAQ